MEALINRIDALEAKATAAEAKAAEAEAKFENAAKFENLATKAIDSIYQNTSSSFAPEAKASIVTDYSPSNGSIFSNAKKELGLK